MKDNKENYKVNEILLILILGKLLRENKKQDNKIFIEKRINKRKTEQIINKITFALRIRHSFGNTLYKELKIED